MVKRFFICPQKWKIWKMFATGAIIHSTCLRFGSIFFLKYIFNIQQQQQQQRQQLGNNESKKKVHDFNFLFFSFLYQL